MIDAAQSQCQPASDKHQKPSDLYSLPEPGEVNGEEKNTTLTEEPCFPGLQHRKHKLAIPAQPEAPENILRKGTNVSHGVVRNPLLG